MSLSKGNIPKGLNTPDGSIYYHLFFPRRGFRSYYLLDLDTLPGFIIKNKMTKKLKQKLKETKKRIMKEFCNGRVLPVEEGLTGVGNFMGAFNDRIEFKSRLIEGYKEVFLQEDKDAVRDYLQNKRWKWGVEYKAANQALEVFS